MASTYKALALLLTYPDAGLRPAYAAAFAAIEADALVSRAKARRLRPLIEELAHADLFDLETRYVQLFDRTRALSLNLFEHVHGESRDRGQAMVELLKLYSSHGLELTAGELPDYLPAFLEFLSTRPIEEAATLLGEAVHVIETLAARLKKRKSPYASVFEALASLAVVRPAAEVLAAMLSEPEDDPDDLAALDKAWAEEPVTFGPGEAGCPKVADLVARMNGN